MIQDKALPQNPRATADYLQKMEWIYLEETTNKIIMKVFIGDHIKKKFFQLYRKVKSIKR